MEMDSDKLNAPVATGTSLKHHAVPMRFAARALDALRLRAQPGLPRARRSAPVASGGAA